MFRLETAQYNITRWVRGVMESHFFIAFKVWSWRCLKVCNESKRCKRAQAGGQVKRNFIVALFTLFWSALVCVACCSSFSLPSTFVDGRASWCPPPPPTSMREVDVVCETCVFWPQTKHEFEREKTSLTEVRNLLRATVNEKEETALKTSPTVYNLHQNRVRRRRFCPFWSPFCPFWSPFRLHLVRFFRTVLILADVSPVLCDFTSQTQVNHSVWRLLKRCF